MDKNLLSAEIFEEFKQKIIAIQRLILKKLVVGANVNTQVFD